MPKPTTILDQKLYTVATASAGDTSIADYVKEYKRVLYEGTSDDFWNFMKESLPIFGESSVAKNPAFIPLSEFFVTDQPLESPFRIFTFSSSECSLEICIGIDEDVKMVESCRMSKPTLERINRALLCEEPFPWFWDDETHVLFGNVVWRLTNVDKSLRGPIIRELLQQELHKVRRRSIQCRPSNSREPVPRDVQVFVWNRDGGQCVACGSRERLEFDHLIPLSKGGSNTARNIQLLCESCNRRKAFNIGI